MTYLDVPILVKEHVTELQIPMNNLVPMKIARSIEDLDHERASLILREAPSFADQLRERLCGGENSTNQDGSLKDNPNPKDNYRGKNSRSRYATKFETLLPSPVPETEGPSAIDNFITVIHNSLERVS